MNTILYYLSIILFFTVCLGPIGFFGGIAMVALFMSIEIISGASRMALIIFIWLCGELETLLIRFIELVRVSIKNTLLGAWWVLKTLAFMATFPQGRWGLLTLGMLGIVFYQIWPNMLLHLFYHDYFTYIRDR